jgi:hypothetical protein
LLASSPFSHRTSDQLNQWRTAPIWSIIPSNGHVHLRLRHGNRLALRLDRKAVLLEIAGG